MIRMRQVLAVTGKQVNHIRCFHLAYIGVRMCLFCLHVLAGGTLLTLPNLDFCLPPSTAGEREEDAETVAHPGYEVKRPFTMLRYVLVAVIVEIVDRDPKQLNTLPVELWKVLCSWFFRYPHNNLYHGVFYKLVFKALRCNNVGALRMAMSKGRLVAQLVDSHIDGDKVGMHTVIPLSLSNQTLERANRV